MNTSLLHSLAVSAMLLTWSGTQILWANTEADSDINNITELSICYETYNDEVTIPVEKDQATGAFIFTKQIRTMEDDMRFNFDLVSDNGLKFGTINFTSTYNNESEQTYTLEPGKGDNSLNVTYRDRSSSLDKHYKLLTMKFWVEDAKLIANLKTEIFTVLHGNDSDVEYLMPLIKGSWKWNSERGSVGWWGSMPYEGSHVDEVVNNDEYVWWNIRSEAEFEANLWQSSQPNYLLGDESDNSYMVFDDDQILTVYNPQGEVVRRSQYNLLTSNAPEWCVARLYTDAPGIMWPYAVNNYGLDVKEFQILRLDENQLFLFYSYNELGSGDEGTFWNFIRADGGQRIHEIRAQHPDAPIYDLRGQRIKGQAHGLVICNGQKCFMK